MAADWHSMRNVWLVTKDGTFVAARRALAKTNADLLPSMPKDPPPGSTGITRQWAALTHAEVAEGGWDAVSTSWPNRLPEGMARGVGSVVTLPGGGGAWEGGGLRYHLGDTGRAHPQPGHTPLAPDPEVLDEATLAAHAEQIGRDLDLVERGTLRPLKVVRGRGVLLADGTPRTRPVVPAGPQG